MLRRLLLMAVLAPALIADPRQEIYDLFGSMASALSEANPDRFLKAFDPAMKGYQDLALNIRALVEQVDVTSTIELVSDEGDAQRHTAKFDWLLQLAPKDDTISPVRRQKTIVAVVVKEKRNWRIVSFEPLDFFAPPRVTHP